MKANLILPRKTRHPQAFTSPGAIRYRIRFLRKIYGSCLNKWPESGQIEYQELSRNLREMESDCG
jgi:hypothetical protein